VIIKPHGAVCNLRCDYCYFLKKKDLYQAGVPIISDETLEVFTRQYIESQLTSEVTFVWQGGEPTLPGLDFYRKALFLQAKYARPGQKIRNAIQTNATLLDEAWCAFFHAHDFLVGVSLDGPRRFHDDFRHDAQGGSVFERVIKGVELLKEHAVAFNVLCCVHQRNAPYPLDVYRFLRDELGAQFIQFIPIVERMNDTGYQQGYQLTGRSVGSLQYGQFLNAVFDEWIRADVGKVFVQIFDCTLAGWLGEDPALCLFEPECGLALELEPNGDVYSCDHFVEPHYLLGNIHQAHLVELAGSPQQAAFGQNKRNSLPEYCRECEFLFLCHGGCPKNRIRRTPQGSEGLNYLCAGYKAFFAHVERPMQRMARLVRSGQPAAGIINRT